jgi:hypothetical protein
LVPCATAKRGRRIRVNGSHTCLPPAEGIRHTLSPFHTTRKSAPFRVEHVVSYPDHYGPAFAYSAILCLLPIHVPCDALTRPAHPGRKTTGLPSSTAMTRWGGCYLSTGGAASACPKSKTRASDRLPLWLRRIKLFSSVFCLDSRGSSLMFPRPPSLAPRPPHSWQAPKSFFAARFRRLRGGTLSGCFRRHLAETAIAHRLLMAEHQVGSTSFLSR